jgi:hypothetical protein
MLHRAEPNMTTAQRRRDLFFLGKKSVAFWGAIIHSKSEYVETAGPMTNPAA